MCQFFLISDSEITLCKQSKQKFISSHRAYLVSAITVGVLKFLGMRAIVTTIVFPFVAFHVRDCTLKLTCSLLPYFSTKIISRDVLVMTENPFLTFSILDAVFLSGKSKCLSSHI